jgi:hypothetical protein
VGIISGTYSSIFIACALVLWWHKGERPKTGAQAMVQTSAGGGSSAAPTAAARTRV